MTIVQFNILKSVKSGILAFVLLAFSGLAVAQPGFYNGVSGTAYNAFPLNSTASNKVQWIYGPSLFNSAGTTGTPATSGVITKIYFRLGTTFSSSATYTDFTILLGQNQGTITSWPSTTFVSGLTTVFYSASFTTTGAASTAWYGITLSTPFAYDPSKSLVFEMKVSGGTGNQVAQVSGSGNQRNWGAYSGSTGAIGAGLVDFGFDLRKSRNDLTTVGIVGLANTCGNAADPVVVQIRNTGVVDIAAGQNIPLRTVVTGAGSATFNKVFNRAIKIGNTDTIHMGNLNTTAITGAISLKSFVSFSLDSIRTNDTNVTSKTFLGPTKPKPDFSFKLFCDSVKFTNTSTDVCNVATSYRWEFDNGKTSKVYSPTYSYNSTGTYNVKLLVFYGSGLKDSISKQVIVYAKPQANFAFTNQCLGVPIDFSNFSYGTVSYLWSFGDATTNTTTSPSKTYTAAGSYSVKLMATTPSNCKDSITKSVTVYTKPVVSFTINNACIGSNSSISNTTTGGATFSWDLGDGTSSSFFNPSKIYTTAGTYGVLLTATSAQGCSDKTSRTVTINPLPVSSFNVANGCLKTPSIFNNTSTNGNTYAWTFGEGNPSSLFSPPNRTYSSPKTYNVTLVVTSINGCTHSSTVPLTIYAPPKVNFTANDVCVGISTDFVNQTVLPSGGGDYIWRFGDGSTSIQANPSYKYNTAGPFDVHLVATSIFGCKDSTENRISIFDKPKPSYTALDVCDGQAVKFINTTSGAVSFSWDFGDGGKDNSGNPTHTYAGPNLYKVSLTVTSSDKCQNIYEGTVTVKANPEIVFIVSDHCHGADAVFSNSSTGATSFTWKFGDGDSSKSANPAHKYLNAGNYNVKLKGVSAKGCSVEQTKSIKVFARPVPAFIGTTVCHGLNTQFTNSTTGAVSYLWNFGDGGGSSTATNPPYQYTNAGIYKVILTAISMDNCKEEISKTITVASIPVPIFLVQDVCIGTDVKPSNASQGSIISQKWRFGDGFSDTTIAPTHAYTSPGIYKITLTVNTGIGCSDSTSKTILVYTKPIIKVGADIAISKGFSAQLYANGGTDYLWSPAASLDNPAIANPVAKPETDTRYTVRVLNSFGCSDTASMNVKLVEDYAIIPNNLITPNTNGQNDLWKIKGIEFYPQAKVLVFDQWGRIILEQDNYKNTWDGTMNGKPLPDGTYYYAITFPGSDREYKGTLTILRN